MGNTTLVGTSITGSGTPYQAYGPFAHLTNVGAYP